MKQQAYNPYLPSWEYIPDGEPYVFGDRVYVYGSHDSAGGHIFCTGDYMGWSAPVDDLGNWRCEGVIYPRTADPMNKDGRMNLFAPDVTQGPDGRYYLYYVLDKVSVVSVAVCDTPAGKYEFLGYVHDKTGALLGERPGDEPQFDPGVLTEGNKTYLYTGFCYRGGKERHGAMATVLGADMLTMEEEPVFIVPGCEYAKGTEYEEHPFFEAPSMRKRGDTYYFVYSSVHMHELCYATSSSPTQGFRYGGVVVSNADLHMADGKPADMPMAYGGNNHGSIIEIGSQWYVFYHRHTHGTWYSRQACAEPIRFAQNGSIPQVGITSCGLNGGPLKGEGEYPAYIACHLFTKEPHAMSGTPGMVRIMQEGEQGPSYITDIYDGTTIGFKYFDCQQVKRLHVRVRGYFNGQLCVRTSWDGPVLGRIAVSACNVWTDYAGDVDIADGIHALYLTFEGTASQSQGCGGDLLSICFE